MEWKNDEGSNTLVSKMASGSERHGGSAISWIGPVQRKTGVKRDAGNSRRVTGFN